MQKTSSFEHLIAIDEKHRPGIEAAVMAKDYAEAARLHAAMQRELDAIEASESTA